MADLRVDPVLDQFGVIGGFRERGEVSAERRYPGNGNGGRDDQNQNTGKPPSHRACTGMEDREHEQAREEHELTSNPASPAFKKPSQWRVGYGIHRVQIRGTGPGFRNRLRRNAKRVFMRGGSVVTAGWRPAGENKAVAEQHLVPLAEKCQEFWQGHVLRLSLIHI